jgi:hypothetical protein
MQDHLEMLREGFGLFLPELMAATETRDKEERLTFTKRLRIEFGVPDIEMLFHQDHPQIATATALVWR